MISTTVTHTGDASASVNGAILLYGPNKSYYLQHNSEAFQFATIHDVEVIDKKPVLMPGRPMSEADLATIHKSLSEVGASNATHWIDSSVLAQGPNRMVWWTPPQMRALHFKQSRTQTFDAANTCPIPGLVWVADKCNLYVYAVKGALRPTPDTKLFQAPLFNVWSSGQVCAGSAVKPELAEQWIPAAWERFFLGSFFTHPNFSQKDRLIKGMDPTNFWKKMIAAPSDQFPEERLVILPLVVGDLISPQMLELLRSRLPRATGEF